MLKKRTHPKNLINERVPVVHRDARHLYQVISFFIEKVNDAIDNEESINMLNIIVVIKIRVHKKLNIRLRISTYDQRLRKTNNKHH